MLWLSKNSFISSRFMLPWVRNQPPFESLYIYVYIYLYIYTLAAVILKTFEPNFNTLFLGLIARISSKMSKIGPRGVVGGKVRNFEKVISRPLWKIFEPNIIMLFLGLIAQLSSKMSKIGPRGWSGEEFEILKKLYLGPYAEFREKICLHN